MGGGMGGGLDGDVVRAGSASSDWAAQYAALRDALLNRIEADLRADPRFTAAWLFGSFGRGEADTYSDLDVTVVVAAEHAETLCARPWPIAGRTTPERLALVSQWGTPVVINEVHANAPDGGAHTNVMYANGTRLDMNLARPEGALRPHTSVLLFDEAGVAVEAAPEPEALDRRRQIAGQRMALFWIMVETTAKYRLRGWDVQVQSMLTALRGQVEDVRRVVAGDPPRYSRPATRVRLAATPAAQVAALRALMDEMESLIPAVQALGEEVWTPPRETIEPWLSATPRTMGGPGQPVTNR